MPGPSALPDLTVEIAFTPNPWAGYLRSVASMPAGAGADNVAYDATSIADYVVQAGDYLEYDVWWEGASQYGAFDLGFSDGTYLTSVSTADQNGLSSAAGTDLSARANGVWYHRAIPLAGQGSSSPVGKTISKWLVAFDPPDAAGALAGTIRVRDVMITDGAGTTKFAVWRQPDGVPTFALDTQGTATSTITITRSPEAPTWTDVTPYFLEAHPRRGRQRETDTVEAGTMSLVLDNRDRRFDPTNTASPYYPNVLPMRRVRLTATYPGGGGGTVYRRFTGYIERWPPTWSGKMAEVSLDCTDGFEALTLSEISGFRAVEQSGARVGWALDLAGWSSADRSIDAGNSQVEQSGSSTGTLLDNAPALGHIQDVAAAEMGAFFIAGDGTATFQQRQRRLVAPYNVSQGTFSNAPAGGEFLYLDPQIVHDKDDVYNDVRSRPVAASTDSIATDIPSQITYGRRTLSESIWLTTLTECLNRAQYILARRKQASLRIDGIRLEPQRQDALWAQVVARELGDRITVKLAPYGGGPTITRDVFIESIQEDIVARDGKLTWSAQWALSPADVQSYWILGDANLSLLGQSTVLAY